MIKLNKRLTMVSAFISSLDKVIDIGCDHALLDIYLAQKDVKYIVASDINIKPLEKAKENINKYNLNDKIITRLGNGLECIDDNIDTIIISGMGGKLITQILSNVNKYNINKIVVSPNNDFDFLRNSISKLGFRINRETMVYDNDKYYLVCEFIKGKKEHYNIFSKLDLNYIDNINYFKYVYFNNLNIIKCLPNKLFIKKIKLMIINLRIKIKGLID